MINAHKKDFSRLGIQVKLQMLYFLRYCMTQAHILKTVYSFSPHSPPIPPVRVDLNNGGQDNMAGLLLLVSPPG